MLPGHIERPRGWDVKQYHEGRNPKHSRNHGITPIQASPKVACMHPTAQVTSLPLRRRTSHATRDPLRIRLRVVAADHGRRANWRFQCWCCDDVTASETLIECQLFDNKVHVLNRLILDDPRCDDAERDQYA